MAKQTTRLRPDPRNANRGTERGRAMLEHSLRQYGAGRSILTDKNGVVIAGNKTLEMAEELGLPIREIETDGHELVVVRRKDLDLTTDASARELAIADNRVGQINLDWDPVVLAELAEKVDLSGLWNEGELKELLASGDEDETDMEDPGPQIDKAEELRVKYGVETGQLWQVGEHRLLCGDCTESENVARVMGSEKANAVLTDPPYGQNQPGIPNDSPEKSLDLISSLCSSLPLSNGIAVFFQSPRTFPLLLDEGRKVGLKFERMLWLYKVAQQSYPWRGWILKSESILVFTLGVPQWQDIHPYQHDMYQLRIVYEGLDESLGWHGAIKPISVVRDICQRISPNGAIMYDPFLGSGTTLIACQQLGRKCRGIEIDPSYVALTLQRWADMTGQEPRLL